MIDADLHERFYRFAFQGIRDSDRCGFSYRGMRDQRAFDFGGADAVSGYVEDIIGAAQDGDVSVFVFHGDVAGDVAARAVLPVPLVAGGIAPHRALLGGE